MAVLVGLVWDVKVLILDRLTPVELGQFAQVSRRHLAELQKYSRYQRFKRIYRGSLTGEVRGPITPEKLLHHLEHAVQVGYLDVVQRLLSLKNDFETHSRAFASATQNGRLEIVQWLLTTPYSYSVTDRLFSGICKQNHLAIVRELWPRMNPKPRVTSELFVQLYELGYYLLADELIEQAQSLDDSLIEQLSYAVISRIDIPRLNLLFGFITSSSLKQEILTNAFRKFLDRDLIDQAEQLYQHYPDFDLNRISHPRWLDCLSQEWLQSKGVHTGDFSSLYPHQLLVFDRNAGPRIVYDCSMARQLLR